MNKNNGALMVVLTAIYCVATIWILWENQRTVRLTKKMAEDNRVYASLWLQDKLSEILLYPPMTKQDAIKMQDKMALYMHTVIALGGPRALNAFLELHDYIDVVAKAPGLVDLSNDSIYVSGFFDRVGKLQSCFRSLDIVKMPSQQEKYEYKKLKARIEKNKKC